MKGVGKGVKNEGNSEKTSGETAQLKFYKNLT